jgi:glycosyltransferase involved in cell wall biosynthesis
MYVGGLQLDRWRTLRDLGRLLDAVDGEMCRWRLRIHAPARDLALHGSALAQPGSIEIGASLAPADVPAALAAADVLVHVESFDPEITRYTRLSLSTKIPQYLAAGRPLLAIGPRANASISLVEDSGSGVVVGESSMEELHEALVALGDLRTREGMAQRAVATAQRDFSMSAVRGGLRDVLGRASSGAPLVDRS